jgi:hypothetical protein
MKRLLPAALLLPFALAAGCNLFHHRKAAAPELPPAAGIEAEFRTRWIDRRVHDLLATNATMTEAEARQLATAEFAKQYPYVAAPAAATGR